MVEVFADVLAVDALDEARGEFVEMRRVPVRFLGGLVHEGFVNRVATLRFRESEEFVADAAGLLGADFLGQAPGELLEFRLLAGLDLHAGDECHHERSPLKAWYRRLGCFVAPFISGPFFSGPFFSGLSW